MDCSKQDTSQDTSDHSNAGGHQKQISATSVNSEKENPQVQTKLNESLPENHSNKLSDKGVNYDTAYNKLNFKCPPAVPVHDKCISKYSAIVSSKDACHATSDSSNKQSINKKEEQISQELVTDTLKREGFRQANASSTLKLKLSTNLHTSPNESSQELFYGTLDISTVASLLPKDRTSIEESALEHILNLETDQLRQNPTCGLPTEDANGFTSEQDSGIFDLSLVQQEDFDDGREGFRDGTIRNHTPEQRRKYPHLPTTAEVHVAQSSDTCPSETENCQKLKRTFRIPSYFNGNLPLLPGSADVFGKESAWTVNPSSSKTENRGSVEKQSFTAFESVDPVPKIASSEDPSFISNPVSESEVHVLCSAEFSDLVEDSSQDIQDNNLQDSNMGKKTQSLSKGKQPHVVYSKEEFSEEYASPQRSKSLDKKKYVKKVGEKKDKKKPKDRKRILSDPSQGINLKVAISAPIPFSQDEIVRNKRHTIGAVPRTSTQETGTDTIELLEDSEILTVHQQPLQLAAAPNESNNNQEQHKSKKRLAHSRPGGISPEVFPMVGKHPMNQQQGLQSSPEVISDILGRNKASTSHQEADVPPPKPKRLSLTNQLQKPNDKSIDVSVYQDGSPSLDLKIDHLYERKTEIAVERQVLLKQATKCHPLDHAIKVTDTAVSSQNTQPEQSDIHVSNPYTVVTRYVDGEEELILGALPLQNNEKQISMETEIPVSGTPRKQDKSTGGRKFRHYACIEPVGKPVQMITSENRKEESTSKCSPTSSPREDASELNLDQSQESSELTSTTSLADVQLDETQAKQTPPVVITGPSEDISPKSAKGIPESPDASSPHQCLPSSPEPVHHTLQSPAETTLSLEVNRSRLDSSTDSASTISIPPQSPPDLDYQDLLSTQTPSEHSQQTPSSELSIVINFVEPDPAMEQKMVTVSSAMMPEPQKAEVTIISEGDQEMNSTDEVDMVEKQEVAELEQSKPLEVKDESGKDLPSSPQMLTSRTDIPSISSKDEDEADNEEDEDSGVYDASYRHSDWIYVGNNQELQMMTTQVEMQAGTPTALHTVAEVTNMPEKSTSTEPPFDRGDETRESVTTTVSETEFRTQYQSLAYRRVHRKTSAIDYQRLSLIARERKVIIKKINNMFGFRIQYSKPVVVTDIDKGGAAEQAGLRVGDMVLKVNGHDVRQSLHSQVVRLAMTGPDPLDLVVGTNVCNTLNLYAEKPVMSGCLHKLGGAGMIRTWKKRWFVLKHDNCLYYYKTEDDIEPLGAIVLCNYTVMKARDVGKPFAFKLTKCKARTYYFYTPTEEEMGRWAKHITEAAKPQNTSDIWLDISTHNVGLPALSIKNPDCHGFMNKLGAIRKTWKRRFCVLKDACLYYYKDMDAQHALGVAHFHGYSIQETEIGSKKFGLILKPPSKELRIFYFFADHETDRKRWVAAFALSIGRWIQTNNGEESDEESAEMLI